jgi:hypothetical protein
MSAIWLGPIIRDRCESLRSLRSISNGQDLAVRSGRNARPATLRNQAWVKGMSPTADQLPAGPGIECPMRCMVRKRSPAGTLTSSRKRALILPFALRFLPSLSISPVSGGVPGGSSNTTQPFFVLKRGRFCASRRTRSEAACPSEILRSSAYFLITIKASSSIFKVFLIWFDSAQKRYGLERGSTCTEIGPPHFRMQWSPCVQAASSNRQRR